MSLSLSPRWGAPAFGADSLWQDHVYEHGYRGEGADRAFDAQVGYGLRLPGGGLLLTPFGGYSQAPYGRRLQVGALVGGRGGGVAAPAQVELRVDRAGGGVNGTAHHLVSLRRRRDLQRRDPVSPPVDAGSAAGSSGSTHAGHRLSQATSVANVPRWTKCRLRSSAASTKRSAQPARPPLPWARSSGRKPAGPERLRDPGAGAAALDGDCQTFRGDRWITFYEPDRRLSAQATCWRFPVAAPPGPGESPNGWWRFDDNRNGRPTVH